MSSYRQRIRELLARANETDGRLSGMPLRLADAAVGDATIADMLRAVAAAYDSGNKVVTLSSPEALPTGTPSAASVTKAYNQYDVPITVGSTVVFAIHRVAVHTDATHGQVDWLILPLEGAGANGVRFELKTARPENDPAPANPITVYLLDNTDTRVTSGSSNVEIQVYDNQYQFTGPAGRKGTAVPIDGNKLHVVDIAGLALHINCTLDEPFDYDATPPAASATLHFWDGPADQRQEPPTSSGSLTVYDLSDEKVFLQHKSGDQVYARLQTYAEETQYGYVAYFPQPQPEILCGFVETGTPSKGDDVDPVEGSVFSGRRLRYDGTSPGSDTSYVEFEDVYLVRIDGSTAELRHLHRMEGFKIGRYTSGTDTRDLYITQGNADSDFLLAKIEATVPARSSDSYGSLGSVKLGKLVAGTWTQVYSSETVWNPSLSEVHVPSGAAIHIPVIKHYGLWVLQNATDLQQVEGFIVANDQSLGKDAGSTDVLWQDDGECDA